jgi:hypothetical protein
MPYDANPMVLMTLTMTGTRDMAGPKGLTTEKFIDKVAWRLGRYVAAQQDEVEPKDMLIPSPKFRRNCELYSYHE